jgi:hypothetical protein
VIQRLEQDEGGILLIALSETRRREDCYKDDIARNADERPRWALSSQHQVVEKRLKA